MKKKNELIEELIAAVEKLPLNEQQRIVWMCQGMALANVIGDGRSN